MVFMSAFLLAAAGLEVTVKEASIRGSTVIVMAEVKGKPTDLECTVNDASCAVPKP